MAGAVEVAAAICPSLSEPVCFVAPASTLFPKLYFGQTVCVVVKRTTLETSCVPNKFQVSAKITRERNSSNKHLPEFLYRQGMYFSQPSVLEGAQHTIFLLSFGQTVSNV